MTTKRLSGSISDETMRGVIAWMRWKNMHSTRRWFRQSSVDHLLSIAIASEAEKNEEFAKILSTLVK